jgi:hypothetical protein
MVYWGMAITPEKKVKDKVVKLLKAYGIYYFYASTHGYGRSGVPDLVCCFNGHFVGIECKAGKNKPTALQEKEMLDIRNAGGTTFVVNEDNLTMLGEYLKEQTNGNKHEQGRTNPA